MTESEKLEYQKALAVAYHAAEACNLSAVLRYFTAAADRWRGAWDDEAKDLLLLYADIVLNILGRPNLDRILDAYKAGREAAETTG